MNKKISVILVALALLAGIFIGYRGYRSYKARTELELVARRDSAERDRLAEAARQATAELEA
ncbi:MAG: hypothetical protein KBF26_09870, partial [Opitutaceae bacterium]|nr:hypothetical protein [Opitutaceae bacterium]